ncbi:MAG TPA: VanZ family protein [Pyrinomonadaceae bacterium]|jgi:VanZ family protein
MIESTADRSARRSFVSYYLPLIFWMAFIFFASSASFSAANTSTFIEPLLKWLFPNASLATLTFMHFVIRKLAHFTEYAVLAILAARAFDRSGLTGSRNRWFLISAILVIAYALLDEYHQSFVPSRSASVIDSLVDMTGGFTALLIIRRRRSKLR